MGYQTSVHADVDTATPEPSMRFLLFFKM